MPGTPATAQAAVLSPTATLMPVDHRRELFESVWQTVKDHYLYVDFHGVDWQALREQYEPKVMAASSAYEYYGLIADMVVQLNDEHSRFLSPWQAREEYELITGQTNYVGIGILSKPEQYTVLIVYVFPGSPAEQAGLKRRDRITAVDGVPFTDASRELDRIRGPEGTTVTVTVRSPGMSPRDVTIRRSAIRGTILPSAHRLDSDPSTGYLLIPDLFVEDMGLRVEDRLDALLQESGPQLQGLVIDLRANGGGLRSVLQHILAQFVTGEVGRFFSQKSEYPFRIAEGLYYDRLKAVRVVVLVDGGTESNAELLDAVLQNQHRARVVGTRTAGNTETVYPYDFEDGSRLWVAQEGFKLPDGTNLEGRGVIPDMTVNEDWTLYTEQQDPDILKAVELLKGGDLP